MRVLVWMAWALAQDVPVPEGELEGTKRRTFDASEYESLEQFRKLYEERLQRKDQEVDELRLELERRAIEQGLATPAEFEAARGEAPPSSTPSTPAPPVPTAKPAEPTAMPSLNDRAREWVGAPDRRGGAGTPVPTATAPSSLDGALVFGVPEGAAGPTETVVPAGSYVKVRILTGVEANARDEIPMLVQADHALVGPNKRRIDLRGCMVLLQVKGELSTDRVVGQAVRLSCVRDDGETVTRTINGYLTGEDSTFGVTGQLITRQGRVIAAATVAGMAEAAGDAVARAQETRQLIQNPLGGASGEVTNVDGNTTAYVLGTSSSAAAGIIAQWYLKYADQLLPAIAVGSGRDVWVVLLDTVAVPPLAVR